MPPIAPAQTMIAYRFKPPSTTPVAELVSVPSPAHDEVLLKVLAGGVCHSDLSMLDPTHIVNAFPPKGKVFTIGHEGAGTIVAVGASVSSTYPSLTVGAYVAVYARKTCSQTSCSACSHGLPNLCGQGGLYGLEMDGTWAPYIVINASSAVLVPAGPDRIPPGVVSTSTDAILTPYHAMKTACKLQPEHTILCLGIGGLGFNAVCIAKKCLGVRCVIACDTRAGALEDARAAGADYAVTPAELVALVTEQNVTIDFAFDFVASQATFDACFAALRVGGTMHTLGLGALSLSMPPTGAMLKELTWKTSFYGTKEELSEVLQAIADGLLVPKVETRPLSECVQVLEEMHAGKLRSRIALIPDLED